LSKKIAFFTLILVSLFGLNSINFIGCNSDAPVAPRENVSFSQDILPIFVSNCTFPGCHNPTDYQAGIDLTTWEAAVISGSNFGAEIIPYNAKWSHMMQHINRVDTGISPQSDPLMPIAKVPFTNGLPLARPLIETIANWINQGAKNDAGQIAYSNITRKAFITNQASDYVAVVNLDNNHLVRLIDVGGRNNQTAPLDAPHVIICDNQGRYFYVSLIAEGYIEKYDAVTYEKAGRMFAGVSPAHIVISADGSRGWFSNFDATGTVRTIQEFNTQTMTISEVITEFRMKAPHGMRLTHNGSRLVMATEGSEFVYLINTQDNQILNIVPVDPSVPANGNGTNNFVPYQVAITPDDHYAFISCLKSNDVRVFDIQSGTFVQNIPVGLNPLALEISPDGNWCYVPNRNSNSVTVIDVNSRTVVKTISSVGAQPHKIDFTQDGHYAYVTCESISGGFVHHPPVGSSKPGTTCVIDAWNGHNKTKDIEMASFPAGISITPGPGN
jgi:YVTN family beta-propeller protein